MENTQKKSTDLLLKRFKEVNDLFRETITKQEVEDLLKAFLNGTKGLIAELNKRVAENKGISDSGLVSLRAELHQLERRMKSMMDESHGKSMTSLENAVKQLQDKVKEVQDLIPDYTDRFDEIESKIPTLPEELPIEQQRQYTRDLLEGLPDGEKLAISAIEDLQEQLDELKKLAGRGVVSGGIIGRDLVTKYDLSDQLDGVTKTFNIPAVWSIVSVSCSSFPNILRPTIDYTNTSTTITFTDEIDASTVLQAGQTVVLIVVSG